MVQAMVMSGRGRLGAALAVAVSVAALVGSGASATTAPGYRFQLQVLMTDSQLRLLPRKTANGTILHHYISSGGRVAQFPRGVLIEFVFTNHGTKAYLPAIRVKNASQANPLEKTKPLYTASRPVRPGQKISLFGNFYFRGTFQIEKLLDKRPSGQPIQLTIT